MYICTAESPGELGIAGKVWDAALTLMTYLASQQQGTTAVTSIERKSVLELGAGTGIIRCAHFLLQLSLPEY